ncbi:MAG: DASS family sodium-coupled anion symporter [Ignisphaera sp.]
MNTGVLNKRTIIAIAAFAVAILIATIPPPDQLVNQITNIIYETEKSKTTVLTCSTLEITSSINETIENVQVKCTYQLSREEAAVKARSLAPKVMAMIGLIALALILWSTEAVPIPLTGIIIILLLSIFNIMPLATALSYIASEVNILILAGLVISVGLSKHSVDRYISLKILNIMGERAERIVLGMILSTALISMWIPNTAAAAIMIPVAVGILDLLGARKGESNLAKAMMIGVAFGASIGGIGTPVGTPPVPITIDNVKRATGIDISFATWMAWGIPLSIILVFVAWILLILFYKPEVKVIENSRRIVTEELEKLGGLTGYRRKTLLLFFSAIVLWLLDPVMSRYVSGWTYIVSLVIIILFIIPGAGVLDWVEAAREVDWGTLFLVAGGLALGSGLRATRITDLISSVISQQLYGLNPIMMLGIIGLVAGFAITVFCSITATSSAMVPIAIAMAKALNLHPLVAGVVAGVSSCFAFLLPANTPPNAIAYSHGYFRSSEMARVGLLLIILSVLISLPFAIVIVPRVMGISLTTG